MSSREVEETKARRPGASQPRGARLGTGPQQELPQDVCPLALFSSSSWRLTTPHPTPRQAWTPQRCGERLAELEFGPRAHGSGAEPMASRQGWRGRLAGACVCPAPCAGQPGEALQGLCWHLLGEGG